jgi:hypothetical protein
LYRTRDYAFFISAMGKLLVTLFALVFRYLDSSIKRDKSGPRTCFLYNFVFLDLLPARNKTCTATLVKLIRLVPGLAKNAPCFVHYGCVSGPYPDEKFVVTTSIRYATPTNFIAGPLVAIARLSRPEILTLLSLTS